MKYKAGDVVKIKTFEDMSNEYGLTLKGDINKLPYCFGRNRERDIKNEFPDRIFKIEKIKIREIRYTDRECYIMQNSTWQWADYMIECVIIVKCETVDTPIESRFEILDL